jgi:hypothetical protein
MQIAQSRTERDRWTFCEAIIFHVPLIREAGDFPGLFLLP